MMKPILLTALTAVLALLALWSAPQKDAAYQPTAEEIATAQAYLAEHLIPLPMAWEWHETQFGNKAHIRWGVSGPDDAPTLLYIPGYTNTIEMYTAFYDRWWKAGYRVAAADLPGQGGSVRRVAFPQRAWSSDFGDYGDAVAALVNDVRTKTKGPLILVGESFGGHAALRAAADHDLPLDALVLLVPALEVTAGDFPRALALGMTGTATSLGYGHRYAPGQGPWRLHWPVPSQEEYGCATRPDRVRLKEAFFVLNKDFHVGGPTHGWLAGLERSGKRLATDNTLSDISFPVRIIEAENDRIVLPGRFGPTCEKMRDCEVIPLPDTEHCLLFEADDRVAPIFTMVEGLIEEGAE
mgnify:CR=1 FL=1